MDANPVCDFVWQIFLSIRFRGYDYTLKCHPNVSPDYPLFEPGEDDLQENSLDPGIWVIQRESGIPALEAHENGQVAKGAHNQPLRVLPKAGQISCKVFYTKDDQETTVSELPMAPFEFEPNRLHKPNSKMPAKKAKTDKIEGFYHVDRERPPPTTDTLVLYLKQGTIKGLRCFIPEDKLPAEFATVWAAHHPPKRRLIRFAPHLAIAETAFFNSQTDSPSQIKTGSPIKTGKLSSCSLKVLKIECTNRRIDSQGSKKTISR